MLHCILHVYVDLWLMDYSVYTDTKRTQDNTGRQDERYLRRVVGRSLFLLEGHTDLSLIVLCLKVRNCLHIKNMMMLCLLLSKNANILSMSLLQFKPSLEFHLYDTYWEIIHTTEIVNTSTFVLNDLMSAPCSLVSGRPQESDLPHGQQGAVLWASRNTSGVSHLTIWTLKLFDMQTTLCISHNDRSNCNMTFIIECLHVTGRSLFFSTSTSWNVPVLWCCWSSSVPPHRSETISTYLISCSLQHFCPFYQSNLLSWLYVVVCVQVCVEKCPERHMTLVKAKLSLNAQDRVYYKQFCKEGVDFDKMVHIYIIIKVIL